MWRRRITWRALAATTMILTFQYRDNTRKSISIVLLVYKVGKLDGSVANRRVSYSVKGRPSVNSRGWRRRGDNFRN